MAAIDCDDDIMASRLLDIDKKVGLVVYGNHEQVREKLIEMEIDSFNCRGLGSEVKQKKVCEIVRSEGLEFLAIQETKLETCNSNLCAHLWGSVDFDRCTLPSIGRSGGMLLLWNTSKSQILFSFSGTGFLGVCLQVLTTENLCVMVNVYASCRLSEKRNLWEDLLMTRRSFDKFMWCILGDFNAVRQVLSRDVSNYCPIILKHKVVNWGSKPFRFNNCWLTYKGVVKVVEEAWKRDITLP
ncbi:uncharacterized protein LOC113855518 [Abrus precatorius]|uniref:Uncharacterized protein LOC113855518 n=1 Tax=Abrus precatorius TaxID=3816 RepID=A0A8B8KGL6_ABRPR|nr:uncharacterized protein LOC113855518 [Abrus precatorius]